MLISMYIGLAVAIANIPALHTYIYIERERCVYIYIYITAGDRSEGYIGGRI